MALTRSAHWTHRADRYGIDWVQSPIRRHIAAWLRHEVEPLDGADLVVDVGAGTGHNAAALDPDQRLHVVEVDGTLAMLQRSVAGRLRCQADCGTLPIRTGCADVAILSLLLHHLQDADQRRAIDEARRILRPSGLLLVVDQIRPAAVAEHEYQELVRRSFYGHLRTAAADSRFDVALENPKTAEELVALIDGAGFELRDQQHLASVVWAAAALVGEGR